VLCLCILASPRIPDMILGDKPLISEVVLSQKTYQIIREELYKILVIGPLLHSLSKDEGKDLLNQTHAGACGGHIGARALAAKVFR
jgi:hypothetical protein